MERKVKISMAKGKTAEWDQGKKLIPELVDDLEEETLIEMTAPFSDQYGHSTDLEEMQRIARDVLLEDLVVLQLDLGSEKRAIKKDGDSYIIEQESEEDHKETYARVDRLIEACVLDDGVGFKWEFL